MPTWSAPTLAATALIAYYVFYGLRGALGDDAAVPDAVKPVKLTYVQGLGYHMLMDACFMIGVVVNDIAHVMMPSFVAAMLVVVCSQFIIRTTCQARRQLGPSRSCSLTWPVALLPGNQ